MKIDLENAFFYKVEDGKIIYRMSDISLDEFLESCGLYSEKGYLYGEITMVLEEHSLQSAVLNLIYKDGKGEDMDVAAQISPEIVEDAVENMEEDWETFGKNINEFYKM